MYIQTNISAMNVLRNYQINYNLLAKSMERLSTGYRINRAADDAAGLAISEKMKFQINGYTQASRNIQDGISLLQTAEGTLTEVHAMLQRMNVLANQAANGTYSDEERKMLQLEFSQLREEIYSVIGISNFNGITLLNGNLVLDPANNKNGLLIQAGPKNEDEIIFDIPNVLTSLQGISALDISSVSGAQSAIDALKSTVEKVAFDRAKLGAYQNRLEHRLNYVLNSIENLSAAHSRIRDANMAEEMMNFTKAKLLTEASIAMLAQANTLPNMLLKLLEKL